MTEEEALTTENVRPLLSKAIQQELVDVLVGPDAILLLVGTSNDIGRRNPKPLRSKVETEPV